MVRSCMCRGRVACFVLVCGILMTITSMIISLQVLSEPEEVVQDVISLESFYQLADKQKFLSHAEDMHRLRKSINEELSQLEKHRNQLKQSISELRSKESSLTGSLRQMETKMQQIKVDIENMQDKRARMLTHYPAIELPKQLLPNRDDMRIPVPSGTCDMTSCFDYSRCSVSSGFPVYLYDIYSDSSLVVAWKNALQNSVYITTNPDQACLYIVLIENSEHLDLSSLTHWRGDGRNHILVNLSPSSIELSHSRALIAQPYHDRATFRVDFDILLPHQEAIELDWQKLPLLLPIRKPKLLTYRGTIPTSAVAPTESEFVSTFTNLRSEEYGVTISGDCKPVQSCEVTTNWCLCDSSEGDAGAAEATFTLIPNTKFISYAHLSEKLYQALSKGSVPVVLGFYHPLPLGEGVDWSKIALVLPKQRVTELVFMVRNVLDPDIMEFKKQGRNAFQTNLNSAKQIADTVLGVIRTRLAIQPATSPKIKSNRIYHEQNPMPLAALPPPQPTEILGPAEDPFPSPAYQRNYTGWRTFSAVDYLYPSSPWDPSLPTDSPFRGSPYGFRPIERGAGGSGKEFGRSLGGNYPEEQFTIVVLTYNRPDLLQLMISQFNGLPYLNKVVVVWNNINNPDMNMKWPKIHTPIVVIKGTKNSLNNRFLPYEEIETDAVLSMDDDMYLRDYEIIFAFRVWRENRDRIVGFPGRYHAWNAHDNHWNYNSNHSCELSMVLTGAAFFHKYYMYQYSYVMPSVIRAKVDEFMNCEDIAMNFLVSHITGKPPIKTTSRWTFRCPTCGEASLWIDESHFKERHECINFFIEVYGYLPLKFTQFRVDSVLFKTRLPADRTKCFATV